MVNIGHRDGSFLNVVQLEIDRNTEDVKGKLAVLFKSPADPARSIWGGAPTEIIFGAF